MTKRLLLPVVAVLVLVGAGSLTSCSNSAVQARQDAISGTSSRIQENRATRIKARDERMWAARDVWFQ